MRGKIGGQHVALSDHDGAALVHPARVVDPIESVAIMIRPDRGRKLAQTCRNGRPKTLNYPMLCARPKTRGSPPVPLYLPPPLPI